MTVQLSYLPLVDRGRERQQWARSTHRFLQVRRRKGAIVTARQAKIHSRELPEFSEMLRSQRRLIAGPLTPFFEVLRLRACGHRKPYIPFPAHP